MRRVAICACLLLLGCAAEPNKPTTPAPAVKLETKPETRPMTAPDAPAFGLYRLDKRHTLPQIRKAMIADGQSPRSMEEELELFGKADVWLFLDAKDAPLIIHTVEHLTREELELTRHLRHFKLKLAQSPGRMEARCTAEAPAHRPAGALAGRAQVSDRAASPQARPRGPRRVRADGRGVSVSRRRGTGAGLSAPPLITGPCRAGPAPRSIRPAGSRA